MSERRIRKVKLSRDRNKVNLTWEEKDDLGFWGTFTCKLQQAPAPEFIKDFDALANDAKNLLELGFDKDIDLIEVRALSLKYVGDDEDMGGSISVLVNLHKSNSGFSATTPFKVVASEEHENDEFSVWSTDTVKRVEAVIARAFAYIDGERAQRELFEDDNPDQEKSETVVAGNGEVEVAADAATEEEPF